MAADLTKDQRRALEISALLRAWRLDDEQAWPDEFAIEDYCDIEDFLRRYVVGPRAGLCARCGCTEADPCILTDTDGARGCTWVDETQTLCSNPDCLHEAQKEG
jgi:hypothetical protein